VLHKSHFFPKSIQSPEAALAVMLAGRELGLGPMESLRSVYIVDGQTSMSSGLMAAMILQAGHSYEIIESTDTVCTIKFTRSNGQSYTHTFSIEDAKRAGLAGKGNWEKYTRAMLWNRCISAGARAFMPDVIHNLYTPEEMGASVAVTEDGDVTIDAAVKDVTPKAEPEQKAPEPEGQQAEWGQDPPKGVSRPWEPEQLKHALWYNVRKKGEIIYPDDRRKKMIGLMNGKLAEVWAGDKGADTHRVTFLRFIWDVESSKELTDTQLAVMLDWLVDDKDETTGDYPLKQYAAMEAQATLRQYLADAGQQAMDDLFGENAE